MATLAETGRITVETVAEEIHRLRSTWRAPDEQGGLRALMGEEAERLDLFDRAQLEAVIDVCRRSSTLSDAGRALFAVSRTGKSRPNDADRLRKYLARFNLDWEQLRAG